MSNSHRENLLCLEKSWVGQNLCSFCLPHYPLLHHCSFLNHITNTQGTSRTIYILVYNKNVITNVLHIAPDVLKNTNDNKLIKLDLLHTATKHYTDVHRPTKNYLLYFL